MFKKIVTILVIIAAFCTLIALGMWQLQRLEWKESVLADIAKQESIDPMAKPLNLQKADEFQRGFVEGQFMQLPPLRLTPRTYEGQVGYHFIQPFQVNDGPALLVNMGWVSNDQEFVTFNTRQTKIAGYLKTPETAGQFTPVNRPEDNQWYSLNINDIEESYDLKFYPQILYMESPENNIPQTFTELPQPRNKHTQYAAFWFGMAGLLLILSGWRYWQARQASSVEE